MNRKPGLVKDILFTFFISLNHAYKYLNNYICILYNNVGDLEVNIQGLKELIKQTDYMNN